MAWLSRPSAAAVACARRAPLAVIACGALLMFGVQAAPAAAPGTDGKASLESTVRYLQEAQNSDGGFGSGVGEESDPDLSAWAALGLASVGVNPRDQAKPGGVDVYDYLTAHVGELTSDPGAGCPTGCTTTLDRVLLVADAAGTSPHDFGGVDLVKAMLSRRTAAGAFADTAGGGAYVNATIFAILGLSLVHEPEASAAVQLAATWLEREHEADRGWPATCPPTDGAGGEAPECEKEATSVDMTGAALEALNAAGRHDTQVQHEALSYLEDAENKDDAGFPTEPGNNPNSDSTAWVVQGIWASGGDPESLAWTRGASNPLSFMESEQEADGAVKLDDTEANDLPVFNTAYVIPALAGRPLPIAEVPPTAQAPATTTTGPGVIAGGGGSGAQLFSKPQPQSQGRTRGGARVLGTRTTHAAGKAQATPSATTTAPAETTTAAQSQTTVTGTKTPSPSSSNPASPGQAPAGSSSGQGDTAGSGEPEVSGLLLASAHGKNGGVLGAPGLRSAGGEGESWLASAIGALLVLLAAAGSQLERRRPQAVL
jgi:Squalene-hopene cyclase C-terminal domain